MRLSAAQSSAPWAPIRCRCHLLQRGLVDSAAQYIAAHLDQDFFCPQIVVDCGESEEALLYKPKAFETPSPVKSQEGIGFWGVVGAVIVALLILSFF